MITPQEQREGFEAWWNTPPPANAPEMHYGLSSEGLTQMGKDVALAAWQAAQTPLLERLRVAEADAARMNWIEMHPSYELDFQNDEGELLVTVYRVTGYPNDREWHKFSTGCTAREAIDAAIAKEQSK